MPYGHGKVILFGEHSVVHGHPALAVAVEKGCQVQWRPAPAGSLTTLHIAPWNVDIDTGAAPNEGREKLQEALKIARALYDDDVEVALQAEIRLPSGAGMGSSAALGVAVLRALDEARGEQRPDEDVYQRSLAWERVFHGNPSGVDNAMATYGGVAIFSRGAPLRRLGRAAGGPPPRSPARRIRLLAGDSGSPSSTKLMVDSVAHQLEREPVRIGKLFEAIAAIVARGKSALDEGDLKSLGQLMTLNQKLLAGLMLSTNTIEEMIEAAVNAGALGAKVTGAGGGGCMIALVDSDESHAAVKAALAGLGKTVYEVEFEL
jgi:mevalonate kinase